MFSAIEPCCLIGAAPSRTRTLQFGWMGFFIGATLAGVGCQRGPKWDLASVTGKISRSGSALASVGVIFWPDLADGSQGPRASGVSDAFGCYELSTDSGFPGAAPGKYRVCLVVASKAKDVQADEASNFKDLSNEERKKRRREKMAKVRMGSSPMDTTRLTEEYSSFEKTPLRAEVKPGGGQTINFNLP